MSPKRFKWSLVAGIADEAFGIPPDVTFLIVENGHIHKIKAHKVILGIVSPMFKMMFYTTEVGDKNAKEFKIEETTAPAFQILMDAIYDTTSIEESLKDQSVKEIFDVAYLIEQYQISQLEEAVEELLSAFPVADDTVLEVAAEALEYKSLFQKQAEVLLLNCAMFLKPKFKDMNSIYTYAAKNNDHNEVFSALLGLMKDIPPFIKCLNCGYQDCQDGKEVGEDEFREGLIVAANGANGTWTCSDRGTGKITSVKAKRVFMETITPGPVHDLGGGGNMSWLKKYDGKLEFLFACQ